MVGAAVTSERADPLRVRGRSGGRRLTDAGTAAADEAARAKLVWAAPTLRRSAARVATCGAAGLVAALLVTDWSVERVAAPAALGTAIWGAFYLVGEDRFALRRGDPPPAPADAVIAQPGAAGGRRRAVMLAVVVALSVAALALAEPAGIAPVFFPGLPFGWAAAHLVAHAAVRHRERRGGTGPLLMDRDRTSLYRPPGGSLEGEERR